MTLSDRIAAAQGPDRALEAEIADAIEWWPEGFVRKDVWGPDRRWKKSERKEGLDQRVDCPPYTSSVDAALTLVPEGWELASIERTFDGKYEVTVVDADETQIRSAISADIAQAILAAAMKARGL